VTQRTSQRRAVGLGTGAEVPSEARTFSGFFVVDDVLD